MRTSIGMTAVILSFFITSPSLVSAALFGVNAIINGDAEAGTGSSTGFSVETIPGWTTVGNFTAIQYAAGGGFPIASSPGPVSRGANFFGGGPNNANSRASQIIDLLSLSTPIDLGTVTYDLSAYLGGFDTQADNAVLSVSFRNLSNTPLGGATLGPVTVDDRGEETGLFLRSTSGGIPVGTRNALVNLEMTRLQGTYNDGYADNLSLVLSNTDAPPVPAPSTFLLLGSGLAGLIRWQYRKKQIE